MARTVQVFISHDTEDSQFAHRLARDLQRLGVQVWIVPESIRPGESWVAAIERGLRESSHMLVVLTPAAVESRWVTKETEIAIAQERRGRIQVIPLNVKRCAVPLLLSSYQMVSFRRDYDAGLRQIANILGSRVTSLEPVRSPHRAPPAFARPAVPTDVSLAYKVNRNLCAGEDFCEACVDVCPTDAISMLGGRAHIDPEYCIECGACEAECPYEAIEEAV